MRDEFSIFLRSITRKFQSQKVLESLPAVEGMERTSVRGVCPYQGYQRGTNLRYGRLIDQAMRDPDYRQAVQASRLKDVCSIVDEARCINIFLLIKFFLGSLSSRNIIEFGAYKGGNSIFMAMLLRRFYPDARILALDTFQGAPSSDPNIDKLPQDFRSANIVRTRATARSLGLDNLEFIPGLVEDTALAACRKLGSVGLAHVDLVAHEPTRFAQDLVWRFMAPGGYIVQDDALEPTCAGATLAVEELIHAHGPCIEQVWPHLVLRTPASPNQPA